MKLAAELQRMCAYHLRNRVTEIQCVVPLVDVGGRHTHDERWEHDILDALKLRSLHDDAWSAHARNEALRLKAYSQTSVGLADIIRVPQEADMKLVHGSSAENLGIADGKHLRLADG